MSTEEDKKVTEKKAIPGKLFVPTLIIAGFAVGLSGPMLSMLSVNISMTYFGNTQPTSIGLVSQIGAINSVAEVLFALLIGFLAVRFRSKPIILLGATLLLISAIGSFFAPNLLTLEIFYALEGGATVMVLITSSWLIGELLPTNRKAKVVSYMWAVGAAASLAGILLIGSITKFGGWQLNFLLLVIPFSVIGLLLVYFAVPSKAAQKASVTKSSYLNAFIQVFKNRSAAACLIGGLLTASGYTGVFAIAFYRTQFLSALSAAEQMNYTVMVSLILSVVIIVVALITGRIVCRIGTVRLVVLGSIGNFTCALIFFFMPNFPLAFMVQVIHVAFYVVGATSWLYLTLDQVPLARGTMMALRSSFATLGIAISTAIGGIALFYTGAYPAIGIVMAAMILPGFLIFKFFAKDPHEHEDLSSREVELPDI
jgi:predicted MFS family arabinose efflux permease